MEAAVNDGFLEVEGKYLTFITDGQLYGIPIANVQQIVKFQEVTEIPESLPYVMGIINLRGVIIPVVDMQIRFGNSQGEYTERTCIIVTNIRDLKVGFIVESVDEVTDIEKEYISDPPSVSNMGSSGFLSGIGKKNKKVTLLLNLNKLIGEDEAGMLANY